MTHYVDKLQFIAKTQISLWCKPDFSFAEITNRETLKPKVVLLVSQNTDKTFLHSLGHQFAAKPSLRFEK
jgi:hypothetical protein